MAGNQKRWLVLYWLRGDPVDGLSVSGDETGKIVRAVTVLYSMSAQFGSCIQGKRIGRPPSGITGDDTTVVLGRDAGSRHPRGVHGRRPTSRCTLASSLRGPRAVYRLPCGRLRPSGDSHGARARGVRRRGTLE